MEEAAHLIGAAIEIDRGWAAVHYLHGQDLPKRRLADTRLGAPLFDADGFRHPGGGLCKDVGHLVARRTPAAFSGDPTISLRSFSMIGAHIGVAAACVV